MFNAGPPVTPHINGNNLMTEGQESVLTCTADMGYPSDWTLDWSNQDTPIMDQPETTPTLSDSTQRYMLTSQLRFTPKRQDNTHIIECTAKRGTWITQPGTFGPINVQCKWKSFFDLAYRGGVLWWSADAKRNSCFVLHPHSTLVGYLTSKYTQLICGPQCRFIANFYLLSNDLHVRTFQNATMGTVPTKHNKESVCNVFKKSAQGISICACCLTDQFVDIHPLPFIRLTSQQFMVSLALYVVLFCHSALQHF